MKHPDSTTSDVSNRSFWFRSILPPAAFLCVAFLGCGALLILGVHQNRNMWLSPSWPRSDEYTVDAKKIDIDLQSKPCQEQCEPSGDDPLPKGIVHKTSDLEMVPISGPPKGMENASSLKSLLVIPVGIKQKEDVNEIVKKFPSNKFTVMLFHYDGNLDGWKDLEWNDRVLHISAKGQTKWWFAKRFLHPDIVYEYNYIFLWDEDLGVENFDPIKYIEIVKQEELEISQPALDPTKSQIHHRITARRRTGNVHRKIYKLNGNGKCDDSSTGPPCTGWVEMMAPVFSRAAWRCTWQIIQNDLIHAWGLDMKLGYCAQGDRSKKVGVVDSQYIVHKGLSTLGGDEKKVQPGSRGITDRLAVRQRSYFELEIFKKRWQKAAKEDNTWSDPYPDTT